MFKRRLYFAGILALLFFTLLASMMSRSAVLYADTGWDAMYWDNPTLSGAPVLHRHETTLNNDWGDGSPDVTVPPDDFSARWINIINVGAGTYRFTATMDDGMRVWVDDVLIIDAWTDGQARNVIADRYLTAGDHRVQVDYYERGGGAVAKLSWALTTGTPVTATSSPSTADWRGEYFNNVTLSGSPVFIRNDPQIDFNWGYGSPIPQVSDNFSIRWTRNLDLISGRYRFTATSDDGVRVWVNNQLVIDAWYDREAQSTVGEVNVPGGPVPVRVEYYDRELLAEVHLSWSPVAATSPTATPIPPTPIPPTPVPPAPTNTPQPPGAGIGLNVYAGPGENHPVVGQITVGSTVILAGYRNANTTWIMVILPSGTRGWLPARYLHSPVPLISLPVWPGDTAPPQATVLPPSGSPTTATVANASYLNVRTGPGVEYNVIMTLRRGTEVRLGSYRNSLGNWVQIVLPAGAVGWVNVNYLATTYPINTLPVWGGS